MTPMFPSASTRPVLRGAGAVFLSLFLIGMASAEESDHIDQPLPEIPADAEFTEFDDTVFLPDPEYADDAYDPDEQIEIYGGKEAIDAPRPWLELGTPLYREGPLFEEYAFLGERNLVRPNLRVYGDLRTAVAYNDNGEGEVGLVAARLNLDIDLGITATERLHAFFRPLDEDNKFTRYEFSGGDSIDGFSSEFSSAPETLFFEGDLGSIVTGLTGRYQSFDLPFAVGLVPLLFQNGIWVDDAFVGGAFALPARNSPDLDITNFDVTFFAGFDKVTSPAIRDSQGGLADKNVNIFGVTTFVEANEGYWEAGLGALVGEDELKDLGYNSATVAFTRRYGGWLSNSVRGFWTFGQDPPAGVSQTADGFALLVENSLITNRPLTLVPYFNAFVGFDQPQPLARNTGLLKNTGINFDTDNLTGFPSLDDTANNTFGGALGVEYLFNLDRQLVVELAALRTFGDDATRSAPGDQFALGVRYQQPISLDWIIQFDVMHGWRESADDISGVRFEIRNKF
ncbi:MAG: hypothetical protein HOI34_17330 [Rhodospirillaceae bacterium]|jgi:hypothetical protein|nr:hypothetical protein [Rhodospirillaceae bacterium]MBT7612112.1 hypothetical protein [Rhodospirillaceae bacterium]